jgi:hypothetical protein
LRVRIIPILPLIESCDWNGDERNR